MFEYSGQGQNRAKMHRQDTLQWETADTSNYFLTFNYEAPASDGFASSAVALAATKSFALAKAYYLQ